MAIMNFPRNIVLDNFQDASTKMLIMASFHNLTSTTVKKCSKSSIAWSAIARTVLNRSPTLLSQSQFFQATSVSVRLTKWKQLCAAFPQDLEDPYTLLSEMEGSSFEKSGAKNPQEAARLLKDKLLFYPNLASNERSFSKLRLMKSYLRSAMKEDRLDALMILASSPDIFDNFVANSWSNLKARRVKLQTKNLL